MDFAKGIKNVFSTGFPLFVVLFSLIQMSTSVELTVQINAGREECFWELAQQSNMITVDYSVIATSQGEHDINFQIIDPMNRPVISEFRRNEGSHKFAVSQPGWFRICFDNTFSHFSTKTVAFGFDVGNGETKQAKWEEYNKQFLQPELDYAVQIDDIRSIMDRVRMSLNTIQEGQDSFRLVESRDRSTAEGNFERVNWWSTFNLLVLVVVSVIQVVSVKSLFDSKYDVRTYLNKIAK